MRILIFAITTVGLALSACNSNNIHKEHISDDSICYIMGEVYADILMNQENSSVKDIDKFLKSLKKMKKLQQFKGAIEGFFISDMNIAYCVNLDDKHGLALPLYKMDSMTVEFIKKGKEEFLSPQEFKSRMQKYKGNKERIFSDSLVIAELFARQLASITDRYLRMKYESLNDSIFENLVEGIHLYYACMEDKDRERGTYGNIAGKCMAYLEMTHTNIGIGSLSKMYQGFVHALKTGYIENVDDKADILENFMGNIHETPEQIEFTLP